MWLGLCSKRAYAVGRNARLAVSSFCMSFLSFCSQLASDASIPRIRSMASGLSWRPHIRKFCASCFEIRRLFALMAAAGPLSAELSKP